VAAEVEDGGGRATFRLSTLSDPASAQELAAWATQAGDGRVDILVNNVGVALLGPTESATETDFDETFSLNVKVPFFLVATLAPDMAERGGVPSSTSARWSPASDSPAWRCTSSRAALEWDQRSFDSDAGLFQRLPQSRLVHRLSGLGQAFRDAPGRTLVVPARGMDQQDLQFAANLSIHESAGRFPRARASNAAAHAGYSRTTSRGSLSSHSFKGRMAELPSLWRSIR
jgi:hypothetical protein